MFSSIINKNEATDWGGGIYMSHAVSTIVNTTIDNNQAGTDGSGMYISTSDVTMKTAIISNNKDLFSRLAVISRKQISSAPKELYNFETSIGHPASFKFSKLTPFTTRPFEISRQGIIRLVSIGYLIRD